MKAYNKKHKRKHTTKVKYKAYEWNVRTGFDTYFLVHKNVSIKVNQSFTVVKLNEVKKVLVNE